MKKIIILLLALCWLNETHAQVHVYKGKYSLRPSTTTSAKLGGVIYLATDSSKLYYITGAGTRSVGGGTGGAGIPYFAGTGITLTSYSFSHTTHTADATGSTSLTVVAIQGRAVASTTPTSGDVLSWNGTAWGPLANTNNAYAAGTGLSLSGNTFTNISPGITYAAGTGITLSGSTFINAGDLSSVNEIQNLTYTAATRALDIASGTGATLPLFATASTDAGLVPGSNSGGASVFLNGSGSWTSPPGGSAYAAGLGITLNLQTFSHTAHTADVTGTTSLTVVALQGRDLATTVPTTGNCLNWSGIAWVPTADVVQSFKTGITTRNINTASGTVNVAHGLGRTPKMVSVMASIISSASVTQQCFGVYDGTNHSGMSSIYVEGTTTATTDQIFTSTSFELGFSAATVVNPYTGANRQTATITCDATNIIFTWTKTGTVASATANILWTVH